MTSRLWQMLVGFAIFVVAGLVEGGCRFAPLAPAPRPLPAGADRTRRGVAWLLGFLGLLRARAASEPAHLSLPR